MTAFPGQDRDFFASKRVVVTGGGGSVGAEQHQDRWSSLAHRNIASVRALQG